jgi:hypothetical protein
MEPKFDVTHLSPLLARLPYDQETFRAGANSERLDEEAGIYVPHLRV